MPELDIKKLLDELEPDKPKRKRKRCQYPGCYKPSQHTHHLTYAPEVTTRLCKAHHEDITIVNSNYAFRKGRKIDNYERMCLWLGWIDGKIKPVRTPEAMSWIGRW